MSNGAGVVDGVRDQFGQVARDTVGSFTDQSETHMDKSVQARITELLGEGNYELANQALAEYIYGQVSPEVQQIIENMTPEAAAELSKNLVELTKNVMQTTNTQYEKWSDAIREASKSSLDNINAIMAQQTQIGMGGLQMKATVLNFMGAIGEVIGMVGPFLGLDPELTAAASTWMDKALDFGEQVRNDGTLKQENAEALTTDFAEHSNPVAYDADDVMDILEGTSRQGIENAAGMQDGTQSQWEQRAEEVVRGPGGTSQTGATGQSGTAGGQVVINVENLGPR